jgi:hypothetical protein
MSIQITTKLKIELYAIAIFFVAAISVVIAAYFSLFKPNLESETAELWFQRSGAITSIFAIFSQLRINSFQESIRGGTFAESWWLYNMYHNHQAAFSWIATCIAIFGALVWGYGDLFYKYISCPA